MLHNGAKRQSREECQGSHNQYGAGQEPDEKGTVRQERAAARRNAFLPRQAARHCQERDNDEEPSDEHSHPERGVIPGGVRINPGESAAVVGGTAGVGVDDLG